MAKPVHPGSIVFADDSGGPDRVEKASAVPDSVAFVKVGEELVPVTRVVASTHGDRRTIRSYGADGRLLQSTIQIRTTR